MEKFSVRLSLPVDPALLADLRSEASKESLPVATEARRLLLLGLATKRGALAPAIEVQR